MGRSTEKPNVLYGDSTLFTRSDEVEAEWSLVQPVLDNLNKLKPIQYEPGSWGVEEADNLFNKCDGI